MSSALDSIMRRQFSEADRSKVQERAARAVETDPDAFQGRFINSDLMIETFPDYSASPQHRNRYNASVRNSAAVLAAEQYPSTPPIQHVIRRTCSRAYPEQGRLSFGA